MQQDIIERLSQSPLFRGIPVEDLEQLLKTTHHRVSVYEKGVLIASKEEEVKYLMIVLTGSVKAEMLDFSGKVLKVADIKAGESIATAFIFGHNNRYPVDVIANENTSIWMLSIQELPQLLMKNEIFMKNFLDSVSDRAQFLSQRIWFLSFKTIKGKLAQYILHLQKQQKKDVIRMPMGQRDLSEFFGVSRTSLARALGELDKAGCIKVKNKTIEITSKKELISFLSM